MTKDTTVESTRAPISPLERTLFVILTIIFLMFSAVTLIINNAWTCGCMTEGSIVEEVQSPS